MRGSYVPASHDLRPPDRHPADFQCCRRSRYRAHSIHRLEEFVGAPLFVRLHRGVASTEKGELLYQHAKRVLHDVAELESAFKE